LSPIFIKEKVKVDMQFILKKKIKFIKEEVNDEKIPLILIVINVNFVSLNRHMFRSLKTVSIIKD